MSERLKLDGQKFGRLQVIDFAYIKKYRTYWNCQCECGKQVVVMGKYLTNGDTKSCGCLNNDTRSINGKKNKKHNNYETLDDGHTKVYFTNKPDEYFLCDTFDLDKVLQYSWWQNNSGYVRTRLPNKKTMLLHDYLLDFDPQNKELVVDHKDHDPTNNTRDNLRIVTRFENGLNRKNKYSTQEKKFRGVYNNCSWNTWQAYIQIQKKSIYLGSFPTFEEAKQARLQAEQEYCPGVIIDDY